MCIPHIGIVVYSIMAGKAQPGGVGGPGPYNILGKYVCKFNKKVPLKISSHYLGPLNNYCVTHALHGSLAVLSDVTLTGCTAVSLSYAHIK